MTTNEKRISALRKELEAINADAALVTMPENVCYLSGFTGYGDGFLLIFQDDAYILTDQRYEIQAAEQATGYKAVMTRFPDRDDFADIIKEKKIKRLAFEDNTIFYGVYRKVTEKLDGIEAVPLGDIITKQRMTKDENELVLIRKACKIAAVSFEEIRQSIVPGMKETDVAAELEYRMRKKGASKPSFDTIIASGPRSAMPHGVAGERVIQRGEPVTCDFGALYQGYCSDMTRTVFTEGKADPRIKEIYDIVKEAHDAAIDRFKPGMKGCEVDAIARDVITAHGYGKEFAHSLGHGAGLEIHEMPYLSVRSETVLLPGMVFSIEPGIYVEGLGGVRIEDLVVANETGVEVMTTP